VAQRAVGYVGDVQFAGGRDEVVCFVDGLEGGVFGLDGVDSGDWVESVLSAMVPSVSLN
jgi:hypothetical protein